MTATPRFALDPAPEPGRDTPPGPLTIGLVAAGGFLVGGPFGLVVALLAVVVWRWHPDWLGGLLVGLLVVAALGSVLGAWPGADSLRQSYADDRSWAAAAGLAAGVALLVAVARAARADRALEATPAPDVAATPVAARLGPWLPVAGVAAGAALVSLVLAPDAVPADLRLAAEALRAGDGLGPGGTSVAPPAAVVLAAAFPAAGAVLLAGLAAVTAVATVTLGTRLGGRRVGLLAGALAAALPFVWDQHLPAALAGLCVLAAVLLAWPDRVTTARGAVAGALLLLATLAQVEATVAVVVLAAWLALWPAGPRRERDGGLAALLVVAVGGLALALLALHAGTGEWLPALGTRSAGPWPLAHLVDAAAVLVALDEARRRRAAGALDPARHLPWLALPALALLVSLVTLADHTAALALGPVVAVGAAARLVGPAPTRASGERAARLGAAA